MDEPINVALTRAAAEAEQVASRLEELQRARVEAARAPLVEQLDTAGRWRDVLSQRVSLATENLSAAQHRAAVLAAEVQRPPSVSGGDVLRALARVTLLVGWLVSLLMGPPGTAWLRALFPVAVMWVAYLAWPVRLRGEIDGLGGDRP